MVLVKAAPDQGGDGTKKKKLGHLEKSDGRRLVEYMIVVSSLTRETQCDDGNEEQFKLSTTYDDDDIENNTAHNNGIGNNDEVLSTVGAERIWKPRNPACVGANDNDGAAIMRTTTSIDRSQQNNIEFHRGPRPENIVSVLSSSRYVSPGFIEPDNTITDSGTTTTPSSSNVLVVLCGPTNLVEKTKRDLANNPLTRSWRVMVAS